MGFRRAQRYQEVPNPRGTAGTHSAGTNIYRMVEKSSSGYLGRTPYWVGIRALSETRINAGKKGAEARWQKNNKDMAKPVLPSDATPCQDLSHGKMAKIQGVGEGFGEGLGCGRSVSQSDNNVGSPSAQKEKTGKAWISKLNQLNQPSWIPENHPPMKISRPSESKQLNLS